MLMADRSRFDARSLVSKESLKMDIVASRTREVLKWIHNILTGHGQWLKRSGQTRVWNWQSGKTMVFFFGRQGVDGSSILVFRDLWYDDDDGREYRHHSFSMLKQVRERC